MINLGEVSRDYSMTANIRRAFRQLLLTNAQLDVVFIGGGLTSTQAANVYSRIHTYLTAVGAPSER